jgi:hypothetical protein
MTVQSVRATRAAIQTVIEEIPTQMRGLQHDRWHNGGAGTRKLFLQAARIPCIRSGFFEPCMPPEEYEIEIPGGAVALLGNN